MARRNIIIYLRVSGPESYIVDSENNLLTQPKYPLVYYSDKPNIKIRPLQADGTPYSVGDFVYSSYEFGIDNDWDTTTAPMVYSSSDSTTFTIQSVTEDGTTYTEISFPIDAKTTTFQTKIGTSKRLTDAYAELAAYNAGETQPSFLVQFNILLQNRLVDSSDTPPAPVTEYLTPAQIAANYIDLTANTPGTLTDNSINYIALGDATSYLAVFIRGAFWAADGTINTFDGDVKSDGTNAYCNISVRPFNGTYISGVTLPVTADVSGGNIRLVITCTGVTENLTLKYNKYMYVEA